MKIHSDILTEADIHNATRTHGMKNVYVDVEIKGSRSRKRGLIIKLGGTSNRNQNPGTSRDRYVEKAATFDEWGMVIQALFLIDPEAIIGQYQSQEHFEAVTFERYVSLTQPYSHQGNHKWMRQVKSGVSLCTRCGAEFDFHKLWSKGV